MLKIDHLQNCTTKCMGISIRIERDFIDRITQKTSKINSSRSSINNK